MKKYIIQGREAGNMIAECDTYEQAKETLTKFEATDWFNGTYTENYYQIIEVERKKRSAIELTREYAKLQYFDEIGWFQIDECHEWNGICCPMGKESALGKLEMDEIDAIVEDLGRFYQIAKDHLSKN